MLLTQHETLLWMSLVGLCLLGILIVFIPLRPAQLMIRYVFWIIIALLFIFVLYTNLGSWSQYHSYIKEQQQQKEVNEFLSKLPNRDLIIHKLREHLKKSPQSPRGWFLLGRLYATEGQWLLAKDAFATAVTLNPNDPKYQLQYVLSLWQLNNQKVDQNIKALLLKILAQTPKQPDALAILALDAYQHGDYKEAIQYWQSLLEVLPKDSPEADAARQWIAQAYKHI